MLIALNVERAILAQEPQDVQRGKIAGRVVEEHVFAARVGAADLARSRTGMPVIDGVVELHARIGTGPGRLGNRIPQIGCADRLGDAPVRPADQIPFLVVQRGAQEIVGHPHRIVGVLAGNGEIRIGIPVDVVGRKGDRVSSSARHSGWWCGCRNPEYTIAAHPAPRQQGRCWFSDPLPARPDRPSYGMPPARHQVSCGGICDPATSAATFCSSTTFHWMKVSISG